MAVFYPIPPILKPKMDGRYRARLCENWRAQFARRKFFSIWSICKPKVLATAIRRRQ
jgi:hypothetical protein